MQPYFISDRSKRTLHNFRLLMQAMAHPGSICQLETRALLHDFPALAVAECLMDHEVSFSLAGQGLSDRLHAAIRDRAQRLVHLRQGRQLPARHGLSWAGSKASGSSSATVAWRM